MQCLFGKKIEKGRDFISRYSGKCDLRDTLEIHEYTEDELKNNVKIYIGYNGKPLQIDSYKSLIPYYPYIIGLGYYNNLERKYELHLSSKSYVDIEEEDVLNAYLKSVIRIYNRCKRKKIEFDVEEAVKELSWCGNKEQITELINRVKENGKRASIENIHLPSKDYYRQELVDEMLRNGLNPADYGYERFINK